jgi:hypothetical protein
MLRRREVSIVPRVEMVAHASDGGGRRVHCLRHHSLYVPRDFDVSPYFRIAMPTLTRGFDFHRPVWAAEDGRSHDAAGAEDRPVEALRDDVR